MISFIVPAHNEEDLIGRTLDAMREAAGAVGGGYERIVVDDGSTDATAALASRHGARVISVHHRQIARARNTGAHEAQGDLLVFVDADTVVPATTLAHARDAVAAGAVGGGALPVFSEPVPPRVRAVIRTWHFTSRTTGWAAGCFLFARREVFEAVGGFDQGVFAGEEVALSRALKRVGRFAILSDPVYTSDRKLRRYPLRAHFKVALRWLFTGGRAVRRREGLELWYGDDGR